MPTPDKIQDSRCRQSHFVPVVTTAGAFACSLKSSASTFYNASTDVLGALHDTLPGVEGNRSRLLGTRLLKCRRLVGRLSEIAILARTAKKKTNASMQ